MTEAQAVEVALAARQEMEVPEGARVSGAERAYIELAEGRPEEPSRVRDVLVWLVRFVLGGGRWVELAISDPTTEVVRVRRSR
ncbi:hypothetical protein NVS55_38980 [Myxococcus stipitatus]|uniref:hypothetical protein n=1 Tax=Myxococcus stipitatus TaxID=83455 RepID=UPI00314512EF